MFFIDLGQHNDSRMNIAIALTAARMGATVANHTDVVSLIKHKDENGKEVIKGANLRDMVTGKNWWKSHFLCC